MQNHRRIQGIILAAGGSSRYGECKQLVKWDNKTLIEHALDQAQSVLGPNITLVLGANHNKILSQIDIDQCTVIINNAWDRGLSTSIHKAIASLPKATTDVMIMLADQPLIQSKHLQQLLDYSANEPNKLIASHYNDSLGVPAIFPEPYFNDLLQLKGDSGAKQILNKNLENVLILQLPEARFDIDTQEDFNQLLES